MIMKQKPTFNLNNMKKIMMIAVIMLVTVISVACGGETTTTKATNDNQHVIDSLKNEIALRNTIIGYANTIMDNNELWDRDGSDEIAEYLLLQQHVDFSKDTVKTINEIIEFRGI